MNDPRSLEEQELDAHNKYIDWKKRYEAERTAREQAERRVHDLQVILNFRDSLDDA